MNDLVLRGGLVSPHLTDRGTSPHDPSVRPTHLYTPLHAHVLECRVGVCVTRVLKVKSVTLAGLTPPSQSPVKIGRLVLCALQLNATTPVDTKHYFVGL